jgi:vesicle coat complex subunit
MEEVPEEIASLIESLGHSDKRIIRRAAESLISAAPQLPFLAQKLDQLLHAGKTERRWPIAYVLARISSPSSLCLEVLKETLDSKDPDIRWAIAVLLVGLAKNAREMLPLFFDLLRTGTPTQRRMAVYCLRDLRLRDATSLQTLVDSLQDPDPLVRVAIVTTLQSRTELDKDHLNHLLRLFLEDPDPRVRHTLALTLAELGSPNDEIHAALANASRSDDPNLKKAAIAALARLKKKAHAPTAG